MATAVTGRDQGEGSKTPAEAFVRVTSAAIDYVTHRVSQTAAGRTGGAAGGSKGSNPVWASIKLGWSSAGPRVKAAIVAGVVAIILMLLLSPVLLLVFLLSWLVIAAVEKVRSGQP